MHPAPSVILFTTLSGLGFGLLFFLALGFPACLGLDSFCVLRHCLWSGRRRAFGLDVPPRPSGTGLEGLHSMEKPAGSAVKVGVPYSRWSSWDSMRLAWCFLTNAGVFWVGSAQCCRWPQCFTTSMIYTQLKTIPRWNMNLTPAMFLSFSLAGGALLAGQTSAALPLLLIAGLVQILYWRKGDQAFASSGTDLGTATGLGARGSVRAFEPPHTGTNYLLREFVHVVGRKHAEKLRVISFVLAFVLPVLLLLLPFNHVFALLAVASHLAGVATSRWLFFAQAEHVVGLYYGKR